MPTTRTSPATHDVMPSEDETGDHPDPVPLPPSDTWAEGLQVDLNMQCTPSRDDAWCAAFINQFRKVAYQAAIDAGRIDLTIINDDEMARLHEQYQGVTGTTDVLTFDLRDHPDQPLEGDLAICIDEAERQAAARGHDVDQELLLYALHGLLHLLGFNDDTDEAALRMHRREDELLVAAGLSPIYARPERSHRNDAPADRSP